MKMPARLIHYPFFSLCLLGIVSMPFALRTQAQSEPAKTGAPQDWTAQQDHKNMMEQLGITVLRPGPSGQAGKTNSANYDEAKANPFPDLPDVLTLKNGDKVTT